jgi:glycine/D-amino acid oxidase-like deaminating enzyme
MNIAIIGAGFSGLAVAWYLLQNPNVHLTIFDPAGIGGGASAIAAGLLHSYAGLHSKLNWKGREGYQASLSLLETSSQQLKLPVYAKSGLIRIALTAANEKAYGLCAERYEDVDWLSTNELQTLIPYVAAKPAIFTRSALTVNSSLYLQGLWKFCLLKGSLLEKIQIFSLEELKKFDFIIVANGAAIGQIVELQQVPITTVKGQILELTWPKDLLPLPCPLNSQAYIIMNSDNQTCVVGATFEKKSKTSQPDIDFAIQDLLPKAVAMIPALKNAKVVSCKAALRASTLDHKPYIKKFNNNCWILSGMGSKGLLYHALFAQQISYDIFKNFLPSP